MNTELKDYISLYRYTHILEKTPWDVQIHVNNQCAGAYQFPTREEAMVFVQAHPELPFIDHTKVPQ